MSRRRLGLYATMTLSRTFELAVADLWHQGAISGEMHLSTGEEAVTAGIAAHLEEGDAVALDHRATSMLVAIGVPLDGMLREMLGKPGSLGSGDGGHMHLHSREHLAMSAGIVGSSAPLGAGLALAAQQLRPGRVAISTFGEGAANQGMLMEALNLAVVWQLPQVFVCKDNDWALATRSSEVTGGDLVERARSFGMPAADVDGLDPVAVFDAAYTAIEHARSGAGPTFLRCRTARLDGHLLGDQVVRIGSHPLSEGRDTLLDVLGSAVERKGGGPLKRIRSLAHVTLTMLGASRAHRGDRTDPVVRFRTSHRSSTDELDALDERAADAVADALTRALEA